MRSAVVVPMVVVFAVALIAHLLVFVQYRSDPFTQTLVSDALSYHEWARRIADHGLAPEPVFHQAPLFPLLLAAIYRLGFPHGAIVAQMVSSSLAIALLVPLARLYLRSVSAGVVAGALGILHAPFVFHGMKLLPIPLTLLTQAMAIVLVGLARRSGRAWQVVLAGIGCGFACLARTEFLLFIPVAILALVFPVRDAAPRRWGLTTLLLCSGIALVLAPVTLHNFSRGDHVLVSASAGENLYIGNQRGADGGHTPLHDQAGDLFSQRALAEIVAEEQLGRQARPSEISSYWRSRAIEEVLVDPTGWLVLETKKLWRIVHPGDPTDMYSLPLERREYLTALFFLPLSSWGLWILAGIGVSFTWRAPERLGLAWPLLALIGVHIVVLMAFFVSTRLKMPLMFFLTPFAGLAVVELWRGREPRTGRLIIVATVAVLLLTSVHWLFFTRPSLQDELRLVSVLSRQSRLDEALSLLDPWVRESDPDPLAVDHAGWIWSKKGELVQAQSHYLRALEIGLPSPSREAQTHSRLASVSEQLGQVEIAATHHDAAVSVAPDSAGARHERALFLLRRGMTERGVADLREAVRMAPGWEDPRRTLRSLGINPDALPEDRVSPPW